MGGPNFIHDDKIECLDRWLNIRLELGQFLCLPTINTSLPWSNPSSATVKSSGSYTKMPNTIRTCGTDFLRPRALSFYRLPLIKAKSWQFQPEGKLDGVSFKRNHFQFCLVDPSDLWFLLQGTDWVSWAVQIFWSVVIENPRTYHEVDERFPNSW